MTVIRFSKGGVVKEVTLATEKTTEHALKFVKSGTTLYGLLDTQDLGNHNIKFGNYYLVGPEDLTPAIPIQTIRFAGTVTNNKGSGVALTNCTLVSNSYASGTINTTVEVEEGQNFRLNFSITSTANKTNLTSVFKLTSPVSQSYTTPALGKNGTYKVNVAGTWNGSGWTYSITGSTT